MHDITREYANRRPLLEALAAKLEENTQQALDGVRHIDRITFRAKDPTSFTAKALKTRDQGSSIRKYDDPLTQLEDQVAGRVITFFRDDIATVRDQLTSWFGSVEHETKVPSGPAEFGYESDHFVFVIPEHYKPSGWEKLDRMPTTFELQIRTLFMHAWAEPQHDLGYKGDLDAETRRELAWLAASAWGADRILNDIARRTR
ncbi:hypothetical protein ITJ66_14115 [Plantibacter sp. VKM Ac-2885]|uniref:GTP pyrophosphokinase n=1 Tax=Plantibacter sp. VKM Ac-2885 TaxID=2783828 RepID=UPI00188B2218|nr:hypothetical protein [Plantibacter sp. VKM Ac-2885]